MANTTTPLCFLRHNDNTTHSRKVWCACVICIGEAAKQAIAKTSVPERKTLTASDRCLLCGDVVTTHAPAAARAPYALCHGCLISALETAHEADGASFVQVNF